LFWNCRVDFARGDRRLQQLDGPALAAALAEKVRELQGERGGQVGLGCQLKREAGQVGQPGVSASYCQLDDPGQRRGEHLVESRPDRGLRWSAAGQFGEQPGKKPYLPMLSGSKAGCSGREGG
jgi:hypothetical protein